MGIFEEKVTERSPWNLEELEAFAMEEWSKISISL